MSVKKTLFATLALCSALGTLAVPVTFQVDMTQQIANNQFDPGADQVEARGSFNNWSGGFILEPTPADQNIYAGVAEIDGAPASTVEYKFVKIIGGNATWETRDNRSFPLPAEAQTLPVVFFDDAGGPANVTFQVNMASQVATGAFDPAADTVSVRGSFNNWGTTPLSPDAANPDIFTTTIPVAAGAGSEVQYKFHIQRPTGETWENDPNRRYTHTGEDQTLPVVYFNNVSGVPIKVALDLEVDLSAQILRGSFDPAAHEVYLRGNKVGWSAPPEGLKLEADTSRSGVYTNKLVLNSILTGEPILFKFTIWDPVNFTTIWEDGADKSIAFTGSEPVVDGARTKEFSAFFNGISVDDLLAEDTVVTFRVDMNGATRTGGAAFDPATESVWLNGSFVNNGNGWGTWGALDTSLLLVDDGTAGDITANDGIYTVQVTFPAGSAERIAYKYGIESLDNEAAVGNDHIRFIRNTGTYTLPLDKFGTMTQETATQDLGSITIAKGAPGRVLLTWTGAPGVKLQRIDLATGAATDVPGTEGQSSADLAADQNMAFYRLAGP